MKMHRVYLFRITLIAIAVICGWQLVRSFMGTPPIYTFIFDDYFSCTASQSIRSFIHSTDLVRVMPAIMCAQLRGTFNQIASVVVDRHDAHSALVHIASVRPRAVVNNDFVYTQTGELIDRAKFAAAKCMDMPTVHIERTDAVADNSFKQCVDHLVQYKNHTQHAQFNDYLDVMFADGRDCKIMIRMYAGQAASDVLYDECAYIKNQLKSQGKLWGKKGTQWIVDARFADQLVVYPFSGERDHVKKVA